VEEKARSRVGPQGLDKERGRLRLNPKSSWRERRFARALGDFSAQKADDLFAAIGYGKLSPKQVLAKLVLRQPREKPPEGAVARSSARARVGRRRFEVRGFDDLMSFGALLQPDSGEKIVGYITRGKGVRSFRDVST